MTAEIRRQPALADRVMAEPLRSAVAEPVAPAEHCRVSRPAAGPHSCWLAAVDRPCCWPEHLPWAEWPWPRRTAAT